MGETIAVFLGMAFVGIIVICVIWTILGYIWNRADSNEIEENMKKFENQKR